jgi:hypothetical protein
MAFASPEEKFGIKLRGRSRTFEQNFSMILGAIYLLGGIIDFSSRVSPISPR